MIAASVTNREQHNETFEAKLQLIRDRVASVVHQYHTGCYLVGRPGTSKTFTVKQTLHNANVLWTYRNARMTPMGLFEFMAQHPDYVIVLDDISSLFKNDQAMQILLSALDGEPGSVRYIPYKSKDKDLIVPSWVRSSPSATSRFAATLWLGLSAAGS